MKGQGSYQPKVNERVLISSPNADDSNGYVYMEHDVLWIDDTFILYGNKGYWPNLHKIEHCHIKQLP